MNDLFSGTFSHSSTASQNELQMSSAAGAGGVNLDRFFSDVEAIKDDLKEIETIYSSLKSSNEESKTVHSSKSMKDLRAKMDRDVSSALKKAKLIKVRLEGLDRANVANRQVPGCGPGSSADRTRSSVVSGLRKKLKEKMDEFQDLRERIGMEHRETVERRYFTVTGENPDEKAVDLLISTGQSESFLQKAIQEQGRGRIIDTISEIQERHDAVKDMEKNLKELHQLFLDMAVLVQYQGEHLDDIEANIQRANSFVTGGTRQLQAARKHQKNTRKWTCYAIILLLVIILIVVLSVRPWK